MKKCYFSAVLLLLLAVPWPAQAAAKVQVTLPDYAVTLNDVTVDNAHLKYPLLRYQGMTYFPLSYDDSRFMGLETSWTAKEGLAVERTDVSCIYREKDKADNSGALWAEKASFSIQVEGERVSNGDYPFLNFRGVAYMPLTAHYCTELLGWQQRLDEEKGLVLTAGNPRIQQVTLEGGTANFVLKGSYLWAAEDQAVVKMPLTEPQQRTVVKTLSKQAGELGQRVEFASFEHRGEDDYAVISQSGLPRPTWSYYRLLPDGQWERGSQDSYRFDGWQVTILPVDRDIKGNLTITALSDQRTIAADERYHYDASIGEWEQLLHRGEMIYLLASTPNSPEGTKTCQLNLRTGETKIIGDGIELVMDGDWLYYVGYDDSAGRDAFYRYSLVNGQTERVEVNQQAYDMSMLNKYTVLGGWLYYCDYPEMLRHPQEQMTEQEQEAYNRACYAASHSGDLDLYRKGEEQSLNPGGKVLKLAQAGDYVYAICAPRGVMAAQPYRLLVFDRAGKVVFKTTDEVDKVSIAEDGLAYSLGGSDFAESEGIIYYVDLKAKAGQ